MASSENNNIFSDNFGLKDANPFSNEISHNPFNKNSQTKRLNGYDSTILNNANFKDVDDGELSIDYRIREKEDVLKELETKIKTAENYGSQNESLGLKAKRQRILQELASLEKQKAYGERYSSSKPLSETFKEKIPVLYYLQNFVSRNILAKISKKVHSFVALSDSLEQLSDISKSVDELMDLNIPYGERSQNYEKLTLYLGRANSIHSKISKTIRM